MAGSAVALNVNRIVGQAFIAITRSDSARQHGANRTVAVTNRHNKGDFFPALKGSADAVIVGDRNGTIDRVILRLSDPVYDRLTASVDFKATQRGVDAAPALKNGIVAGTSSSSASDKVAKVLKETGRPISLNNVAVFVDARATAPKGAKGVLPAGATAVDCTGWGCAA